MSDFDPAPHKHSSTPNDPSNRLFQLAVQFVNETGKHLFLTGKAGTGKTTFLKYIRENSFKRMAVIAPTGVAAINAGGVTMHSFFQLPFGPFIPTAHSGWDTDQSITDQHSLFKNIRFNNEKKQLLQELEMIVIDEVSMLRADMLDAIDLILRHFRQMPLLPFGGIQMIFIGDLFQLPPVVNNDEWEILKRYYKSPFFFDAQVIRQSPPLYLELKKIYRQSEAGFISLLNNIRNNQATAADIALLQRHYDPQFQPARDENYIILTSHNANADAINKRELGKLTNRTFSFEGEITGEFSEKALPADMNLHLKEGAQVMFLKNDKGENRRYFNGKIAQVTRIKNNSIFVEVPGHSTPIEIEKETWRNIRYRFNTEKNKVEEEELGSFSQYPLRLAWAITIHKSQGLTFEKAIIDAGASFAAGQIYVALSRLTSLDGLVLHSRIHPDRISTDERVLQFVRSEKEESTLHLLLQEEQSAFVARQLVQSFDWTKPVTAATALLEGFDDRMMPGKEVAVLWTEQLLSIAREQQDIALKFKRQLEALLSGSENDDISMAYNRTVAAASFFKEKLQKITASVQAHINDYAPKQRVKKYISDLEKLNRVFVQKGHDITQAVLLAEGLASGKDMGSFYADLQKNNVAETEETSDQKSDGTPKEKKGATKKMSLDLFLSGKSIPEIAALRGLAVSTIETHLTSFLESGEVEIRQLVSDEKTAAIQRTMEELSEISASALKGRLGDAFSFGEIRAVMKWTLLKKDGPGYKNKSVIND